SLPRAGYDTNSISGQGHGATWWPLLFFAAPRRGSDRNGGILVQPAPAESGSLSEMVLVHFTTRRVKQKIDREPPRRLACNWGIFALEKGKAPGSLFAK